MTGAAAIEAARDEDALRDAYACALAETDPAEVLVIADLRRAFLGRRDVLRPVVTADEPAPGRASRPRRARLPKLTKEDEVRATRRIRRRHRIWFVLLVVAAISVLRSMFR